MLEKILGELSAYSAIEISAVLLGLAYIILAARNNRWCWAAAFISSCLFVYVMWQANLIMDTALNSFYVAMAIYGWITWSSRSDTTNESQIIPAQPWRFHAVAIVVILLLTLVSGSLLSRYTEASFPFLDSLTTWGSLLATWMLARRMIATWLYWISLDSVSIYLYFHKDLHFTMALFMLYVGMSLYAYFHWRSLLKESSETAATEVAV